MYTFQEIVAKLSAFWHSHGCIVSVPYDIEKGAGTSNPQTFFRCLGPEPYRAAYIEPCRRPKDGRYALNPLRMQHYFQFQVILKPSPVNIQDLYLQSLEAIGFDLSGYDIRFVHDDWEQPTLGAWGLGWEVWVDGMECSQFTYFQSMAEISLKPVTGELTYGIERLIMQLQKVDSFIDIQWNEHLTYGDIYKQNEIEWSEYNFKALNSQTLFENFEEHKREAKRLIDLGLPIPAYDFVLKASHSFNLLDAHGVISVAERQTYIANIRDLSKLAAECYLEKREKLGFPLLGKWSAFEPKAEPAASTVSHSPINKEKVDFLLEIGCEEIPAGFVSIGLASLERQIKALLQKEGLTWTSLQTYGTPRRLAVSISDLSARTKSKHVEKKGPPVASCFHSDGTTTQIGTGFLKSLGHDAVRLTDIEQGTVADIQVRMVKDVAYLFAIQQTTAVEAFTLLCSQLPATILGIEFPKKMRWANFDITFARPLRWIVALIDQEIVPITVGPVTSGRSTFGHRLLDNHSFEIPHANKYVETLRAHSVLVDPKERLQLIQEQLQTIQQQTHCTAQVKERLCQEVVYLVEKPFLTIATFDPHFLKVPKEVLISEMVEHQRYFPLTDAKGELTNQFIITCNVPATDSIRHGNQRVLSSRLADGVFLFEQDLAKPLESFNEKLKKSVFQKGLGSLWDKVERLQRHARTLLTYFPEVRPEDANHAALICKADLATEMVGEFPELQGQMGRIYAERQNLPQQVCLAIDEHWMPRGEKAPTPQTATGALLSIADKIDNLLGFFGLDLKPTSSSDPYALRRQALGLIRIILEQKRHIPLKALFTDALAHFPNAISEKTQCIQEILEYCILRAKGVLCDMGFLKDEIESCFAVRSDDFFDVLLRLQALQAVRQNAYFLKFVEVHKRCAGQIAGKANYELSKMLLREPAEVSLHALLETQRPLYEEALTGRSYSQAFGVLAKFQPTLAELFETVKILDSDETICHNRLALLQQVAGLFSQIADFQKLQYI